MAAVAADTSAGIEVLDAFAGVSTLQRRSPTLDGSIPLRAARACAPLLEGNEFGLQLRLERPLRAERVRGRWRAIEDEAHAALARAGRATLPMLRARGLLAREAWPQLDRSVIWGERDRLFVWTGLCVRPCPGTWLWLGSAANRRNRSFVVPARVIPCSDAWTPLLLELEPAAELRELTLHGELACLALLEPGLAWQRERVAARPELARRHFEFYTQDYFTAKRRGEVTKRYRQRIDASVCPPAEGPASLVELAGTQASLEPLARCLLPSGFAARVPTEYGELHELLFANMLAFTIRWDGHNVALDYDRAQLQALARTLELELRAGLGDACIDAQPGALWYLSKYFTPHPPGEPHFFVKPWAFVRLPDGYSALLDGVHGRGYDIMRGLVHADQFGALPAVFQLFEQHRALRVDAGQPLLRVLPIPRTRLPMHARVEALEGTAWP